MKLIVGLGNPGQKYSKTKHNFGFWVLDQFAKKRFLKFKAGKGEFVYNKSNDLIIAKPMTYMNNSGIAVGQLSRFYNIASENILVVYDDIDIKLGSIRFRYKGGTGGHRGVESIVYHLKSENFNRLKLGILAEGKLGPAEKYVLKPFSKNNLDTVDLVINKGYEAINYYCDFGIEKSMNKFN